MEKNSDDDELVASDTSGSNLPLVEQSQKTQLLTPVESPSTSGYSTADPLRTKPLVLHVESPDCSSDSLDATAMAENVNGSERAVADIELTSFSNPHAGEGPQQEHKPFGTSKLDSVYVNEEFQRDLLESSDLSLHQIARDGDDELMSRVLEKISAPRVRKRLAKHDADKLTPLHYAARYNHFNMCRVLVNYGANIHAKGEDDLTPLHLVAKYKCRSKTIILSDTEEEVEDSATEESASAAERDNVAILNFLISEGARVNEKDFYDLTPLHHGCLRGNKPVVETLLEARGIAIEAIDKQQMTPLHNASVYGHSEICEMLLKAGANIRCKDEENGTPVHLAAAEGSLKIVELLLSRAQEDKSPGFVSEMLRDMDNDGNTPLHLAVDSGHMEVARFLIYKCLEVGKPMLLNVVRSNNETPIHLAASNGHLQIVKLLVNSGAKKNPRDGAGSTPLILASKFNQHQVVDYLLRCGAQISARDSDNFTALLIAANYGHPETISLLIENGANIADVDKNERNVLHQCAEEERLEALQELLKNEKVKKLMNVQDRYGNGPLHIAAGKGHYTILKILLHANADVDLKNEDEQTPLHLAAAEGRVRVIRELVRHDKNIIHDDDEDANTALHLAALAGKVQCVQELLDAGANIGARNAKQWTPLDCCAYAGHTKCATALLESDSPIDPKDKRSITPLHLACQEGHDEMVRLLLKWNADVTLRSVDGRNALDFATDFAKPECAMAIVDSDQWREALRNRTQDIATNLNTQTPMRKLIKKMPDVAEAVFRNCLRTNGKHEEDRNYVVTFDYEFLDDEYACKYWVDQSDTTSERSITISSDASYEVYDENGAVNESAEAYTRDSDILRTNHPLLIMVRSKRETLLRHPLVISLLNYKWRSYGRTVYYVNLFMYTLFMAVFNSYMLTVPPPYAINTTATSADGSCVKVVDLAQATWGSGCTLEHTFWQPYGRYITLVLAGLSLLKELFQLASAGRKYVISITNLIEFSLYALAILTVIDITPYSTNTGIREVWQWQCGSVAIFLSWIGLLLFIQNFPRFGIYVLMFTDIFKTFTSFFAVFLLFIFAFAFSFHALFQNQFAFSFWWNSIIKTIVMMIGEFEYDTLFNSEFTSTGYSDQVFYDAVSYVIFVLFLLIMSIIIMNLLVGLAVDDIKEVQDHAELEGLAMQVKLALDVEYLLPQFVRRRFMRRRFNLSPNHYKRQNRLIRWFTKNAALSSDTINQALNPDKGELDRIKEKVDNLKTRIQGLRLKVRDVNIRTQTIESMLRAVVGHLRISWSDENDDVDI